METLPMFTSTKLDCNQGAVRSVRYNQDGDYCITSGSDKSIKLWNPKRFLQGPVTNIVENKLELAASSKFVNYWTLSLLLQTYMGHGYEVMDARSSCDSNFIASGGMDKCVFLWDVGTKQIVKRYRAHLATINCVVFNEESTVILSGSVDGTVKAWDIKSKSKDPIQILDEAKDSVTSISVSDHEIVTSSLDGRIRRYDLRKGIMDDDDLTKSCVNISLSKDGQCILANCLTNCIKLVDKDSGEILNEYRGHLNNKYKLESCFMLNDSYIVSGSEDGKLYFWDLIQSELKLNLTHPNYKVVHSLSVNPNKNELLSAAGNSVFLWCPQEILV